ncbi:unnamed protein product, partial [Iphiclides podalirius]
MVILNKSNITFPFGNRKILLDYEYSDGYHKIKKRTLSNTDYNTDDDLIYLSDGYHLLPYIKLTNETSPQNGVLIQEAKCLNKRCIRCRSRGELGSCGDPFPFNVTEPEVEMGIHVVACPSGWCGKSYEGNINAIKNDDYGAATERMCLQRPPSDYQERVL